MKKNQPLPPQLYREDLAQIHVDGYGLHWSGAAEAVLEWLRASGIERGLVVDLGCGGGQWLARLADEGYQTCGIDISSSMIRVARRAAPKAKYICGSFADVSLPACDAVTSLGEPMNYLNSGPAMQRTMRNVFAALRPGGIFVFDVRHPAARPVAARDHIHNGQDWFCHARIVEGFRNNSLTRYITTFRRVHNNDFRRDQEVHKLKLFSQPEMSAWLRKIGFRVRTRRAYGDYKLKNRQSVFVCRKPV